MTKIKISNDAYNLFSKEVKERKHENIHNGNSGFSYDYNENNKSIYYTMPGNCRIYLNYNQKEHDTISLNPVNCFNCDCNKYYRLIANYLSNFIKEKKL